MKRLLIPTLLLVVSYCTRVPAQDDLYDIDHLVEINLNIPDTNWQRKLTTWKENFVEDRVLATVTVAGEVYDSIGVRFKGNSSYNAIVEVDKDKLPFNFKISYRNKSQRVDGEYRTLKLSNGFRDPSYLREPLSYHIAGQYMPSPRCNYARLTINGRYYGLYNLTESIDERFWRENYKTDTGILFKCDPESKDPAPSTCPPGRAANLTYLGEDSLCYAARYELKKSKAGWAELIDLTRKLDKPDPEIENWLNVDETLWMHAFNNALVNLDSYLGLFCHNYYLFKDTSGVWRPVVWDMNLSLAGFRGLEPGRLLSDEEMFTLSPFVHFTEKAEDRPLLVQLLDRPLFRKMYVAHLKTIYDEQFAAAGWKKAADRMRSVVAKTVAEEPMALYPAEHFDANYVKSVDIKGGSVIGIQQFFDERGAYLKEHPLLVRPVPTITNHSVSVTDTGTIVSVFIAEEEPAEAVWLAHRPFGRGGFYYTEMQADPEGGYSLQIASEQIDEYFLIAESKISATVLPARSAREWFTVTKS